MLPTANALRKDALSLLLFNCASEYAIKRVQVNQEDLKLDGTHQLLVAADDANILDRSVHTIKKSRESLVVTSKGTGLESNAEKIQYMVMSCDQNAGQNHNINIDHKSSETVEYFKYLDTIIMNQNSIQ